MANAEMLAAVDARLVELSKAPTVVDPAEIVEIVEAVLGSVSGDRTGINQRLHEDIEALAKFIQSAKAEIASLGADEIKTKFLPTASDELNAIVGATEKATNEIFEAVEQIETTSGAISPEDAASLAEAATRIYEACSFQDITGQRISKIVKVLQEVELKVSALLQAFGEETAQAMPAAEAVPAAGPAPEPKVKPDKDLMNGPQLPGNAMSQDDIDALLASFD